MLLNNPRLDNLNLLHCIQKNIKEYSQLFCQKIIIKYRISADHLMQSRAFLSLFLILKILRISSQMAITAQLQLIIYLCQQPAMMFLSVVFYLFWLTHGPPIVAILFWRKNWTFCSLGTEFLNWFCRYQFHTFLSFLFVPILRTSML